MKRLVCCILLAALIVGVLPVYATAAETESIYLSDGSYITVRVYDHGTRASGTVKGGKEYTHYDNDGFVNWMAVLNGTFTYNGSSATCTDSSVSITIYDSSWYTISKSASKSSNKATGSATLGQKASGVTVARVPVSLSLECDADGNLS